MKRDGLFFLFFSGLILLSSLTVFSQDKNRRQTERAELQSGTLELKPITKHEAVFIETQNNENWKDSVLKRYINTEILSRNEGGARARLDLLQTETDEPVSENHPKIHKAQGGKEQQNVFGNEIEKNSESKLTDQSESGLLKLSGKRFSSVSYDGKSPVAVSFQNPEDAPENSRTDDTQKKLEEGFQWRSAINQSLMFLAVQHGYALTQAKTRRELKGNFFKDYIKSVKTLRGWDDGGRFFTNYIAHPMQGSFTGFIQIQNDPRGRKQRFGASSDYWRSRLKALAWTAVWSTQFEIGPLSQASIGNVGLNGKQTYVDLVMTPTAGTAMLITEDAIDRFLIERIERQTDNYYVMAFSRMLLNPTRTMANLLRFKLPWYRDRARIIYRK